VICHLYLSIEQLRAAEACAEGLVLFEAIAALRGERTVISVEWGPLSWLWLEAVHHGFAGWLYRAGLVPMPSFRGANLVGANLESANLRGACLVGADLRGANDNLAASDYPTNEEE
jgi:Pentapeptide repeats (8 copies)